MKESITKFDLEAAFKALDDIDTPIAEKGIRANKPALTEIFSRKSKFDTLFEEYYDISSTEGLDDAKEAREAEIAKAKLERIEKIVDLDAESPEDLLTSYVGKYIIQCPQCMTLFYKNQEDVVASEDDPNTVNIEEVCQHCGNDSGYTLVGKVGEAESENAAENDDFAELGNETAEEETDENEIEAADSEEIPEETSDEDLGELDLDAIDLDIEDDEKTEESFTKSEGNYLLEQLEEDAELETSAEDFEKLINSSEFKKPISDGEARAMMNEFNEEEQDGAVEEALKEAITEGVEVNNEILVYAVINPDGTFAGVPCVSEEEARELAAQKEGRIIVKLDEVDQGTLNEGGLGLLSKTLAKKAKQAGQKIKSKASDAIDKFADNTMTREEKADWVMQCTLKPGVKEVAIDNDGKAIPDERDRKFDTYVVIGYKGYYSDGQTIGMSPTRTNKDLVVGMSEPQFRDTYTAAEELAKGWSMEQKGGPAFILLTKGKDISEAAYLCQYFKGELDAKQDQLEKYFQAAKKDLEGKARIAKGGGIKDGQSVVEPKTIERAASTLEVGDIIVLGKTSAEILEISESKFQAGSRTIKVKMADGDTDVATFKGDQKVTTIIKASNESLETAANELVSIMENLDEFNENTLEALISQSLVEAYKNVAGFRLTNCEYLNEELVVKGKVFFESGALRELAYKFTRALSDDKEITFTGLNEKLGIDRSFSLTGTTKDNIFIAESFKQVKKV